MVRSDFEHQIANFDSFFHNSCSQVYSKMFERQREREREKERSRGQENEK
jgi:hypothetical protein